MKRILSCLLVLTMLISAVPPVPAQAETNASVTESNVGFSGDSSFARLLSNTITTTESETDDLESLIHTMDIQGKTATVALSAPKEAKLVVGIYDETDDTLLGSGVLDVSAGESTRKVTIEIDAMPDYFRAKAFLLDRQSNAPLSQVLCYEKTTKGYQDIASAKTTDFPQELVMNLDSDINTNFAVFKEEVVRLSAGQVTDNGDGSYTISNADDRVKAMKPGDVFAAVQSDGTVLIVKAAKVSKQGNTVVIREDPNLEAADAFQMIKIDVDSNKYGLKAAEDAGVRQTAASGSEPGLYLCADEGDDPLHTSDWTVLEGNVELEFGDISVPPIALTPHIITQYYWSALYSYYSAVVDFTISIEIEHSAEKKLLNKSWKPEIEIPTGLAGVTVKVFTDISFTLETKESVSINLNGAFGQEYFQGTRKFHDISRPLSFNNTEASVGGKLTLSFGMGVGVSILDVKAVSLLEMSIEGKAELVVEGKGETEVGKEKLHVCQLCSDWSVTMGLAVEAKPKFIQFLELTITVPIESKEILTAHVCALHDSANYPYTEVTKEESHAGLTACDRYAYKVTIHTENTMPTPIEILNRDTGAAVKVFKANPRYSDPFSDSSTDPSAEAPFDYYNDLKTDENGVGVCYLEKGSYVVTVGVSSATFFVNDESTEVTLAGSSTPGETTGELTVSVEDDRVALDQSIRLYAKFGSEDVTDKVQWSFEDPSIATIDKSGPLCAVGRKSGTTIVRATYQYNGQSYTASQEITVFEMIDGGTAGALNWSFGADYVLTISGQGPMTEYPWRSYNPRIEKIVIEEGVTSICAMAFQECVSLKEIYLPSTLESVGNQAFKQCCQLSKIEVDPRNPYMKVEDKLLVTADGAKVIQSFITDGTLRIPEDVLYIQDYACQGRNITALELPNSLRGIGYQAFMDCKMLERISIYTQDYAAPPEHSQTSLDCIGMEAFKGCTALKEIAIPTAITVIDGGAFQSCTSLTSVILPDQITHLGSVFSDCTALTYAKLPKNLYNPAIEAGGASWLFANCTSLTAVDFPEGITMIPDYIFDGCTSLEEIVIPKTVKKIGQGAFQNCTALSNVILPDGLTRIGGLAFAGCTSLTALGLPSDLKEIAIGCFMGTGLVSMDVPDSVTFFDMRMFEGCQDLREVTLGSGITEIRQNTFKNSGIEELTIWGNLTDIYAGAFEGCKQLKDIYYESNQIAWSGIAIEDLDFSNSILKEAAIHGSVESPADLAPYSIEEDPLAPSEASEPTETEEEQPSEPGEQEENPGQGSTEQENPEQGSTEQENPNQGGTEQENPGQGSTEQENPNPGTTEQENPNPGTTEQENPDQGAAEQEAPESGGEQNPNPDDAGETAAPLSVTTAGGDPWYHLDLLSNTGTVQEDGGEISVSYTNLIPGRQYLLLLLKNADEPITPENLLYIDQLPAAQDGTLSFQFTPRIPNTGAQPQLIPSVSNCFPVYGVESAAEYDEFCLDGKPVKDLSQGIFGKDGVLLAGYKYAASSTPGEYAQYPASMDVWKLTFQEESASYQAEKLTQMHNLLQYNGCSIRVTGEKGLRVLTSIAQDTRSALLSGGIAGYTLEEYGHVVCWKTDLDANGGVLTLQDSYAKSNTAFSRASGQDAVFANIQDGETGRSRIQFTNVMVKFSDEQCKLALCMRPYLILKDADGQRVTVYGGIVTRSIGYVALQNADVFAKGSAAYDYVHSIINYCYPTV